MKKYGIISLVAILGILPVAAQEKPLTWGDQGNGTYINPILNSDYSDPDVIRVGRKYYMVASDFHFLGMQILESDDMINWRILTQVYNRFDFPKWERNERYAGGSWAPAIRYHAGKFWIYFCTPHEGLFMTSATNPAGPWTPLHLVKEVGHWEDPCPFWDDDGQAYIGRSRHGAGPIIIHKMSADGRQLLDDGVTVYTGPVAEGTKIHKRNGYYYLSIPEGGVSRGYQTILRSKNIYGPYEKKVVLEQGATPINGPHQGAMVDTPEGEWWFYHFQRAGALGRVVHLQPMYWQDNWPVIGVDIDRNGIGEPVYVWRMPMKSSGICRPQTSDEFEKVELSPQWQWNHNPVDTAWSLTEHKGNLTLHALPSSAFKLARNTLTQKIMGYESEATIAIDVSHLTEGGRSGLCCMGKGNEVLGIVHHSQQNFLYRGNDESDMELQKIKSNKIYLRITFRIPEKVYRFSYSMDNCTFSDAGEPFFIDYANWKGVRFGIYHYNTKSNDGYVMVPWANYEIYK